MGRCPSLVQRALDALMVHAYEAMDEFFHKVFNTAVENLLLRDVFFAPESGTRPNFLCRRSDATANAKVLQRSGNCVAAKSFSRRDMMPAQNDHVPP